MMYYYLYCIINNENNKFYFGVHATDNLNDGYMGSGKALKASQELHGIDKFIKFILEFFDTEEEMYAREREIVTERAVKDPNCYNLTLGGNGGSAKGELNPLYGVSFTEEHKNKIAQALKGKPKSEEHRNHLSESKKGKPVMSLRGKSRPESVRQQISETLKGHKRTPESIEKSRSGLKKKWEDPEFKKMMSEKHKGQTRTEETRKKQSEARKKFWKNKKNTQ